VLLVVAAGLLTAFDSSCFAASCLAAEDAVGASRWEEIFTGLVEDFVCVLDAFGDATLAAGSCDSADSEARLLALAADAAVGAVKEARGGLTFLLLEGEDCALGTAPDFESDVVGLLAVEGVLTAAGELAFADLGPANDAGFEVDVWILDGVALRAEPGVAGFMWLLP